MEKSIQKAFERGTLKARYYKGFRDGYHTAIALEKVKEIKKTMEKRIIWKA